MAARTDGERAWKAPEGRGAFGGFIGPRNLLELVRSAAPWLFDGSHPQHAAVPEPGPGRLVELGAHPLGWWTILRAAGRVEAAERPAPDQVSDYFALCLACHVASVATYVPTDVDAKIRRALWLDQTDRDELARMQALALATEGWDVSGVSRRIVLVPGEGAVSGHDGERLSVVCGGWIAAWNARDERAAATFEAAIDAELAREARAFLATIARPGLELDLLRLAAVLTHNAGDVMQSLGSAEARCVPAERRAAFTDLARERFERYGGAYGRAAALYRAVMAPEGHRNYPLRAIKALRASPELLLPIAPFLDAWGALLARWPGWGAAERAEVVRGLVEGCRKVAGQEGYYRALAGFERAHPGGLEASDLLERCGASVRRELKDARLRQKLAVRRESFEASCAKRARRALSGTGAGA
jgi:hypothetical protein